MYNYDAGEYSAGCDDDIWAMFLASQRTKFDDTDVMINIKDHDEDEEGLVIDAQLSKTYLPCELLPFTLVWAIESKEDGK